MGESEETSELEEPLKLTEELWYKSKLDENDRRDSNQTLESDWCKRDMDDRSEVAIEDGRKLCLKV